MVSVLRNIDKYRMPGEIPYFIQGKVVDISIAYKKAYVKVDNGNVYHLTPKTPGIDYEELSIGVIVECEITSMLTRVLSARIYLGHD